jgi:lipopolysaccharide/colanic/teichoic acid biosynthesis glycosyltransferase
VSACERIAAAFLLLVALPVLAICAAAIWIHSGRGPLIAHRRVGWRGGPLWMLKLRTMWTDRASGRAQWIEYIEDGSGPERKAEADPRVSHWLARFFRRHSIDELPQLWHVIRGEMSLVGPRPVTEAEMRCYYGQSAREVLAVKPGIAGLWQTSGRNRLNYAQRRDLDVEFVRNRSLAMYARILLRTIPEVWTGSNTW